MRSQRLQSTPLNILPNATNEAVTFQNDHSIQLYTGRYFFFCISTTCCSQSSCKLVNLVNSIIGDSLCLSPREMIFQ